MFYGHGLFDCEKKAVPFYFSIYIHLIWWIIITFQTFYYSFPRVKAPDCDDDVRQNTIVSEKSLNTTFAFITDKPIAWI